MGQSDSRSFRYGISASVVLTFLNVCRDESQRILSIRGIATGLQLKRFFGGKTSAAYKMSSLDFRESLSAITIII